jgi:ferrochelatase
MTKYIGNPDFRHAGWPSTGVLITNLGTPDAPETAAVRRYLAEFLSDPRVIEVSRPLWWLVLHGFILRTRPSRSAESYRKIWTPAGSPMLTTTIKQTAALKQALSKKCPGPVFVEYAMRYGNPSIKSALDKLRGGNAERILVFPLYPQYSGATTGSTFDAIADVFKTWRRVPELRFIAHYHDDPGYIKALAESISAHWQHNARGEKLLFSFHGLPQHYFTAGDPYHCECHKTARLVAESLGLNEQHWQVTFQSRFGPREWLKPYTDVTLKKLAKSGIKNVDVVCPGFSADCLETLEEINIRYREVFTRAGGKSFNYIPALNDRAWHMEALAQLVIKHCQGWPETAPGWNREWVNAEIEQRNRRAQKMKDKGKEK